MFPNNIVNPQNSLSSFDQILQFLAQLEKSISQKIKIWEFKEETVGSWNYLNGS